MDSRQPPRLAADVEDLRVDAELGSVQLRASAACAIAATVLVLSVAFDHTIARWTCFVLATAAQFWCGISFYRETLAAARRGHANMNTLFAIGTTAAYAASVADLLSPHSPTAAAPTHSYFASSTMIMAAILLGRLLELRAVGRAREGLRTLLSLRPRTARRRTGADGSEEEEVPVDRLKAGDLVRVQSGDRFPADGIVVAGRITVDESMLTGEETAMEKDQGHPVFEGTLLLDEAVTIEVYRVGRETLLAEMIALVREAHSSRAPTQRLADHAAGIFVPIVILVAMFTLLAWLLYGGADATTLAVSNCVAVLVVACPCALGLAAPTAVRVASGVGAREGILVRDAAALEAGPHVDTVVFDKTGSLTAGIPAVHHIEPAPLVTQAELLQAAQDACQKSMDPVAIALLDRANMQGLKPNASAHILPLPHHGLRARIGGDEIDVGRPEVFAGAGTPGLPTPTELESLAAEGLHPILVTRNGRYLGLLGLADIVRLGASEAIAALRAEGLRVILMTGDAKGPAELLGRSVGADEVVAEAGPLEKVEKIRALQEEGHIVAMVGDGITDAPALARADLGIAVALPPELSLANRSKVQLAVASAGITLVRGNPYAVLSALRLSRATMKTIRENLYFALMYHVLLLPLAAGLLTPWLGLTLHPTSASILMVLSSITVAQNSLRLRKVVV